MTSRLTTDELRAQGRLHRALSRHSVGYNSDREKERKDLLYRATQETMAEIYEELVDRREQAKSDEEAQRLQADLG